ncbi:MAG: hypothetical protein D4R38_00830 [Dehalococcoidia bacterium]|nr:MAG: hypothetical protein D4R38_00830 [Dehalococcoidia bacterium]
MEYNQESAALIFTASTVIIVISIMLMTSAWRTLKEIQSVLPTEQRRIYPLFRLREIEDELERHKEVLKNCLWLGSFALGVNVFLSVVSLTAIAGLLVGIHIGLPEVARENFNYALYTLFASPLILFIGVLLIGGYRFYEFMAMKAGRIDPYRWQAVEKKTEGIDNEDNEKNEQEHAE